MKISPQDAFVLVVEDNIQDLVSIARLLAFIGIQRYEWKASGWRVVEFAETMPRVDLVLMDLRLPYEDGFEALAQLRSTPQFAGTTVIAMHNDRDLLERVRVAGFNGFVEKPIDLDRFPDQILKILDGEEVWPD